MPPAFFAQTYQLYKKQTDQIARWLLDTAEQCGYRLETQASGEVNTKSSVSVANTPPASGRLKGRARKEARDWHNAQQLPSSSSPAAAEATPFRIRLPQFAELASVIVDKGEGKVAVPNSIVRLVQDTIEMRRRISDSYAMQTASLEGNSSHLHFIAQLEEVLEILKPRFTPSRRSDELQGDTTGKSDANRASALDNRFGALEIEEPAEVELDSQPPTSSSGPGKPEQQTSHHRKVVYDNQEPDEIYIAIFCLFDDLRRVRMSIQSAWEDYKSGKSDLVTASVATNTALELVQNADEDFCRIFTEISRSSSLKNISMLLFASICLANGVDMDFREHPGDIFNYQLAELGLFLYIPTYSFLEAFCEVIQLCPIPQVKKGYYGVYDPKSDRTKMSLRQKLSEDKVILSEMLPEFCTLGQSGIEGMGFDNLTKGMGVMYRTKRIPLWLVFATQIFLDINHVLRDRVGGGLLELKAAGEAAKSSLTFALSARLHTVNWPKSNDRLLENTLTFIDEWITKDAVDKMKRIFLGSQYATFGFEAYYLLSHHPLFCGSMLFSLTFMMREAGTALAIAWGSILYIAHLYNALRQSGTLDIPWPDMELFISTNTARLIFVGDYPVKIEDCFKRYELMMGVSVKNFAKNGMSSAAYRKGKVTASKKGPRHWLRKLLIFEIFEERYLRNGPINLTADNIEAILNEMGPLSFSQSSRGRRNGSQPLNMLQLLILLKYSIASGSCGLRYDYLSVHFRCLDLLRALRAALDEDLKRCFGAEYLEREDQLSNIAGYIIMTAARAEEIAGSIRELKGVKTRSTIFVRAGGVMKKFIESQGNGELENVASRVL
ncbi:MAG: hypothetical protein M1839_004922 [Geoglossum umbratile]|nr:MAG: hypothetical protein M1839_004922 [Geoglossum umbratile]